jgi:ferredoxin
MKTKLFFFSGTGNSLMLARELGARLNDVEILNIRHFADQETVFGDERIGIIFPVYGMGIPLIVKRFLVNIKPHGDSYIFAISNAASGYGIALEQIDGLLKQQTLRLNAAFNIFMPSNYLPFGGAEREQKQQKKFSVATAKLDEIAPLIAEQTETAIPHQWYIPRWLCKAFYRFFISRVNREGDKFHINSNCSGCGICAKICPVSNISMQNNRPEWGDHCEQCFACLQFCPTSGILRGNISPNRKHYHHPSVKPSDLF